ncbi:MAG: hypothetical protein IKC11_06340 [Clostridia bacterium]|nr:hypothetical protein [Clostridia bacterium]
MKIVLCYKEFELGEMEQVGKDDNVEYVFTPINGCELAKQKYAIPRASQLLSGGVKRSSKIFGEYAYILKLFMQNSYIKSEANIIDGETDFEKLVKISRLALDRGSFYLKSRR